MKFILTVIFSLAAFTNALSQLTNVRSTLEVFDLKTNKRTVVISEEDHFEAPNWTKDGKFLIYNQHGKLVKLNINTKEKSTINTDFADRLNNDHGISPDGKQLAISHHDQSIAVEEGADWMRSKVFIVNIEGGTPRPVTEKTPSFWHGWSPDGKTLTYVGLRNEEFDIYTIDVNGGQETKLTSEKGLDDGPDYSVDGKYIYYNSVQTGSMEVWRMDHDGQNKKQLTNDQYSNWFPHPSPDDKYLVFISYLEDQGSNHPPMKDVALKLDNLSDGNIKTLYSFKGGQGTINVPSWSPDGSQFAFVSYEYLNKD